MGITGAADLTGIVAPLGKRIEIELKSRTAKLTEDQKLFGEAIVAMGGIYVLYRCETDDMAKELDGCVRAVKAEVERHVSAATTTTDD